MWLANNRGNKYSSVDLQDDSIRFWDFSIDELAMYDFPANVEFVTEYTGSKSLVYIGFSQVSEPVVCDVAFRIVIFQFLTSFWPLGDNPSIRFPFISEYKIIG